ncbi:ABC transporter substrate-binding protein [Cellulomonas phragmiteti]|uniref:Sugar ABC transporter substrate-binding protein n=1 Tax=Cellulomonas phragmiteti TaxID=478780 RepID=A0ABQ4DML4_9CELL|nr:extracellular solute-binding protein [Cellulomonas phragmiteti]GIG40222.1 sugar ABC transporter substrate-binding protein [Cellulomonas phragmiteti]
MRTTKRRPLATAVTAASLALALAACSGGSSDGGDAPEAGELGQVGAMEDYGVGTTFVATEPVSFGLMYRDHPNYPIKDDWDILTKLEENQKVTFDIQTAPLSDWQQAQSIAIGAGNAPDIISVTYPGQESAFVAGGAILPVSDYVEHMPNFLDKVERWGLEADIDRMRQEDGKYYLLPGLRESVRPSYSYAVRKDIWEQLGLSLEPETFEDFAADLATVKAAYPDLYPLSDRWSANGPLEASLNVAASNFGTAAGWGYGEGTWWDEDAEEFVYTGAMDEYRELLEYYHGLVADGLMDPESLTQDDDQAQQKLASGQTFAQLTNDQEILKVRTAMTEVGTDGEVVMIRVPAGPAGDILAGSRLVSGLMLASSAAEEDDFLAMLQFIDWLYYSDEGLEFAKWGVEGETFTRDGDTRVLADDIDQNGLNPGAPKALNVDYGYHNGVWMLEHGSSDELDRSMLRPEVVEFVESMSDKELAPVAPPAPLDELEREQVSLWQTALRDHVYQNTAAFILGQRPLSEWDAYVSELEGKNMQQYLDVVNGAQQRYAEANG